MIGNFIAVAALTVGFNAGDSRHMLQPRCVLKPRLVVAQGNRPAEPSASISRVRAILDRMEHRSWTSALQGELLSELKGLDPEATRAVVPAIIELALKKRGNYAWPYAYTPIIALRQIGPVTPEVVPALVSLYANTEQYVDSPQLRHGLMRNAMLAMLAIAPHAPEVDAVFVPTLSKVLLHNYEYPDGKRMQFRPPYGEYELSPLRDLLTTMGTIGRLRPDVVPLLIKELSFANQDNSQCQLDSVAARALGSIGPQANRAVVPLIAWYDTRIYWEDREPAIRAVNRIGAPAVEDIPALIQVLAARQTRGRKGAAANGPGGNPPDAVLVLVRALNERDVIIRRAASDALGLLHPVAAEARTGLVRLLYDTDASVVCSAAISMSGITRAIANEGGSLTPRESGRIRSALGGARKRLLERQGTHPDEETSYPQALACIDRFLAG